jgi:hypothetical protein
LTARVRSTANAGVAHDLAHQLLGAVVMASHPLVDLNEGVAVAAEHLTGHRTQLQRQDVGF